MNKVWVVTMREYISRVRRKTFIWATALAPIGMLLYFGAIALLVSYKSDDVHKILIHDSSTFLSEDLKDNNNLVFSTSDQPLHDLRERFDSLDVDAILHLPEPNTNLEDYTVYYYSSEPLDLAGSITLESALRKSIRNYKIDAYGLDASILKKLETSISIDPEPVRSGGKDSSAMAVGVASAIGSIIGIIMFFVVTIYGMMVMRSVMEEKVNRIVEVIISSLRPIELMIGKIAGVGLVGLTQMAIWAISIPIVMFVASSVIGYSSNAADTQVLPSDTLNPEMVQDHLEEIFQVMGDLNWWYLIPLILLFFLMGFFLYASLFAAVGSAIGDEVGEGQALTIPISLPLIFSFYIMFISIQSPHSSLSVFASIFPLFSPLVMPARLVFDPPFWQVALSIFFLLLTISAVIWISARIYRVGILMYGKKASFLDIARWFFSSQ